MDVIRSCYESDMVLVEGQAPIRVRWFRVDKHAELFPGPHLFGSSVWDDPKENVTVGEQLPLPKIWANGMRPAGLWGRYSLLGKFDDFRTGNGDNPLSLGVSTVSEPVECIYERFENGVTVKEGPAPSNSFAGAGGVRFGFGLESAGGHVCVTCSDFPDDPLCNCPIGSVLTLRVDDVSGAALMDGLEVELTRDPFNDCLWVGTSVNPYDSMNPLTWYVFNALVGTATDWDCNYGTNPLLPDSGQDGQDSATCKPFSIAWNNATCVAAGPFAVVRITAF